MRQDTPETEQHLSSLIPTIWSSSCSVAVGFSLRGACWTRKPSLGTLHWNKEPAGRVSTSLVGWWVGNDQTMNDLQSVCWQSSHTSSNYIISDRWFKVICKYLTRRKFFFWLATLKLQKLMLELNGTSKLWRYIARKLLRPIRWFLDSYRHIKFVSVLGVSFVSLR